MAKNQSPTFGAGFDEAVYFAARLLLALGALSVVYLISELMVRLRNTDVITALIVLGLVVFQVHEIQIQNQSKHDCLNVAASYQERDPALAQTIADTCNKHP